MNNPDRKVVEDFLTAIEPNLAAYKDAAIYYLALKKGEIFELAQARLVLSGATKPIATKGFESKNVKAGAFRLAEMQLGQAHQLGVLVATRESFNEVFNRTLLFPDANRLYADLEQELSRVQNIHLSSLE